MTCKGFGSFRF